MNSSMILEGDFLAVLLVEWDAVQLSGFLDVKKVILKK